MMIHHQEQTRHDHAFQWLVFANEMNIFLTFSNEKGSRICLVSISDTFHNDQSIEMFDL